MGPIGRRGERTGGGERYYKSNLKELERWRKGKEARAEGTLSREPGTRSFLEQGCDSQCGAAGSLSSPASSSRGAVETAAAHLAP